MIFYEVEGKKEGGKKKINSIKLKKINKTPLNDITQDSRAKKKNELGKENRIYFHPYSFESVYTPAVAYKSVRKKRTLRKNAGQVSLVKEAKNRF